MGSDIIEYAVGGVAICLRSSIQILYLFFVIIYIGEAEGLLKVNVLFSVSFCFFWFYFST